MDCYHSLSPKERVNEILEKFYEDHPEFERDDNKALKNDSRLTIVFPTEYQEGFYNEDC